MAAESCVTKFHGDVYYDCDEYVAKPPLFAQPADGELPPVHGPQHVETTDANGDGNLDVFDPFFLLEDMAMTNDNHGYKHNEPNTQNLVMESAFSKELEGALLNKMRTRPRRGAF